MTGSGEPFSGSPARADVESASGRRLVRAGAGVLVLGILLHVLFVASLATHWLDPLFVETGGNRGQAGDYFGIYQAGDNLLRGVSIYSLDGRPEGSDRRVPYFYFYRYLPPTACLAAVDAHFFRPWTGYWIWVVTTEALLLLFLLSLRRLSWVSLPVRQMMAGMALGFFPFYLEQWMGQFSFLMAVFLWWTFLPELRRSAPPPDENGIRGLVRRVEFWCWSASIALKNYPALFALPYLRQRRWQRVFLAAGVVVLVSLPYYWVHPADVMGFLKTNLRPLPPNVLGGSYSLVSLVRDLSWRLPGSFAGFLVKWGPWDVYAGNIGVLVSTGIFVSLSLYATWRMGGRGAAAEGMALWVVTFFLIYKDVWEYHYVMLLPVIWTLAARGPARWPLILGALLALPTPYIFYRQHLGHLMVKDWPGWVAVIHYGSKTIPTLGLYFMIFHRIRTSSLNRD